MRREEGEKLNQEGREKASRRGNQTRGTKHQVPKEEERRIFSRRPAVCRTVGETPPGGTDDFGKLRSFLKISEKKFFKIFLLGDSKPN